MTEEEIVTFVDTLLEEKMKKHKSPNETTISKDDMINLIDRLDIRLTRESSWGGDVLSVVVTDTYTGHSKKMTGMNL